MLYGIETSIAPDGTLMLRFIGTPDDADDIRATPEAELVSDLGFQVIDPCAIGALTDGLIFTTADQDCERPESVWWDSDYAVRDWRETLTEHGHVRFRRYE